MKTSALSSILLSSLFYTTLLSTTFVLPLVMARDNGFGTAGNAQAWERVPNAPAQAQPHRDLRLPQTDVPLSGMGSRQAPVDKSGPDAGMIKAGKVRTKTLKV
jgi:hypothetical protein